MFTVISTNILLPRMNILPLWFNTSPADADACADVLCAAVTGANIVCCTSIAYRILIFQLGNDFLLPKQSFLGISEADRQILLQHHAALMLCTHLPLQLSRLLLESQNDRSLQRKADAVCRV